MEPIFLWLLGNAALLLSAYLLGSLPTGYLLGRWLRGIDIREHGSGSTGATNVLRTLGKGPGLLVLLIDVLKGVGAIAVLRWAYPQLASIGTLPPSLASGESWLPWLVIFGGLAALLGHSKSIWLGFTGGKSVATSLGLLLALDWRVGLATLGVFAAVLGISRIVSLSSISGVIALPLLMMALNQPLPYLLFAVVGGIYVIWRHASNIQRLLTGTEPRLGQRSLDLDQKQG